MLFPYVEKTLKVINTGSLVYSAEPPSRKRPRGIISINHLDCYLIFYDSVIYKKNLDEKSPYFFIDLEIEQFVGPFFNYSKFYKRISCYYSTKSGVKDGDLQVRSQYS